MGYPEDSHRKAFFFLVNVLLKKTQVDFNALLSLQALEMVLSNFCVVLAFSSVWLPAFLDGTETAFTF